MGTDGSAEWLASLTDKRINVIRRVHSANSAALRNAGLALATADYVAFIDDDDRWMPDKLERQIRYHAANPQFRWSYTGRTFIDAAGSPIPQTRFTPWHPHSGWILGHVLRHDANIALPSVMVQRALLTEVRGFDERFRVAQDYELWIRLAERAECGVLVEPLLEVRKHRAAIHQLPEVSLSFVRIYHAFRARNHDPVLQAQALEREAFSAVDAADRLGIEHHWRAALAAWWHAMRICPLRRFVYGAALRLLRRWLVALTHADATPPLG